MQETVAPFLFARAEMRTPGGKPRRINLALIFRLAGVADGNLWRPPCK